MIVIAEACPCSAGSPIRSVTAEVFIVICSRLFFESLSVNCTTSGLVLGNILSTVKKESHSKHHATGVVMHWEQERSTGTSLLLPSFCSYPGL